MDTAKAIHITFLSALPSMHCFRMIIIIFLEMITMRTSFICIKLVLSVELGKKSEEISMAGAVGLTFSLTFIAAFICGTAFGSALCYCLLVRKKGKRGTTSTQEMTEGGVIYEIPGDPVSVKKSDPKTSGNVAYGVPHEVPTTPNPAYEHV